MKIRIEEQFMKFMLVLCLVNMLVLPIIMVISFVSSAPHDQPISVIAPLIGIYPFVYAWFFISLLFVVMFSKPLARRGQATIFIIIGIILLIAVVAIIALNYSLNYQQNLEKQQQDQFNQRATRINDYITNCFSLTGSDGLRKLGIQGGYIDLPEFITYYNTSLWYLEDRNIQPFLNETQYRLEKYVHDNLNKCLDFSDQENAGFKITTGNPEVTVTYGADDVTIRSHFPVTIEYQQFRQEFNDFSTRYDIRFRRIWELASSIENSFFDPSFDHTKPLEKVDQSEFTVIMEPVTSDDNLIYRIQEKKRFLFGRNDYIFRFAYKTGTSTLIRKISLQDNCRNTPSYKPYTVYSPDRDAHLIIRPGTTFNTPSGVCEISIQQSYEKTASSNPFVTSNSFDGQIGMGMSGPPSVRTWALTQPVYNIEQTGTQASQKMRLKLYWDPDYNPVYGQVGILTNHGGGWHPIDSNPVHSQNYVWTELDGFSSYTIADCGAQQQQKVDAKDTQEPNMPLCILFLALVVVGVAFGAGAGLVALGGTAIGGATSATIAMGTTLGIAAGGIVGGVGGSMLTGGKSGKEQCTEFTPTCDGTASTEKEEEKGQGDCTVEGGGPLGEIGPMIAGVQDLVGAVSGLGIGGNGTTSNVPAQAGGDAGAYVAYENDMIAMFNSFVDANPSYLKEGADPGKVKEFFSGFMITQASYVESDGGISRSEATEIFNAFLAQYPEIFQTAASPGGSSVTTTTTPVTATTLEQASAPEEPAAPAATTTTLAMTTTTQQYPAGYIVGSAYEAPQDIVTGSQTDITALFTQYINEHPEYFDKLSTTAFVAGYNQDGTLDSTINTDAPDSSSALDSIMGSVSSLSSSGLLSGLMGGGDTKSVQGGQQYKVCAKVKKCDTLSTLLCQKCNVKCTTTYT